MLSKKYYKILAELIGTSANLTEFEGKLVRFLKLDNLNFNEGKFYEAIITTRTSKEGKLKDVE